MMKSFKVSIATTTPVMIGQWLPLDAVLDGVLERNGVSAEDRVLPLSTWNGKSIGPAMSALQAAKKGVVFVASACAPKSEKVPAGIRPEGDINYPHITRTRPKARSFSIRGGNRTIDFDDVELPYRGPKSVDMKRGLSATMMTNRLAIDPGVFEWLVHGDAKGIADIFDEMIGIGARVASGFGWIDKDSLEITEVEDGPAGSPVGIFDQTGTRLLRPVPVTFLSDHAARSSAQIAVQTVRSPYWDQAGAENAFVPMAAHHAGILSTF